MNEQSRTNANRLLEELARRIQPDRVWFGSVVALGAELGFQRQIETARAIRALITRGRISAVDGGYRLLDVRPIEPGERTHPGHRTPAVRTRNSTVASDRAMAGDQGHDEVAVDADRDMVSLLGQIRALREDVGELRRLIKGMTIPG